MHLAGKSGAAAGVGRGLRQRDPFELLADAAGLDEETRAEQEREANRAVQAALEFALASPRPGPEDTASEVWG